MQVGLCHVSELSDEPVVDINSCYKAGDMVKAKILKVWFNFFRIFILPLHVLKFITLFFKTKIDEKRHRVSLGMKSYFDSDLTADTNGDEDDEGALMDISVAPQMVEYHNRSLVHRKAEPRASVLPLQVSLDESEGSDLEDNNNSKGLEIANGTEANAKKSDKQLKKEARKQRYSYISFYL